MHRSYFCRKVTQNFHSTPSSNNASIGGGRVVSKTSFKLPKIWVIFIEDNIY